MCLGQARHENPATPVDDARAVTGDTLAVTRHLGDALALDPDFSGNRQAAAAIEDADVGKDDRWRDCCIAFQGMAQPKPHAVA